MQDFDLQAALTKWREQVQTKEAPEAEDLAELESGLLDRYDDYLIQGLPQHIAFKRACAKLNPAETSQGNVTLGLVLRCGNYFSEFLSNRSDRFEAVAIHLYADTLRMIYDRDFPDFLAEIDRVQPIHFEHRVASELITAYINGLQFYFDNPALVSDELQKLKIKELLLLLARTEKAADVRRLIAGLFTPTTYDFQSVIEVNLYEDLSTEELAHLCGMSLSTFKRTFRKTYGDAPAGYIRQRRLERAAELLRRTDGRISDVAYDCGFKELAHFSRTFQKVYGVSPTEWRRGH